MQDNLILIDVGNTTMKVGFVRGDQRSSYSLKTDTGQTPDNLGLILTGIMAHAGCEPGSFSLCAVCSVVPAMDDLIRRVVTRWCGCPVLFTPKDLPIPLENRYLRADQVGADRLLVAWAARHAHPEARSLVVIDFGTAVTFDCVQGDAYLGGLIFPGPGTALKALAGSTAKLPAVSLEPDSDEPTPGRDTATSIRHGILFGFASLVDGLTVKLRAQLEEPCRVIATGGFAQALAGLCHSFEEISPGLTLAGLEQLCRTRSTSD